MPWPTVMLVRSCHQPAQRWVTYPGAETPKNPGIFSSHPEKLGFDQKDSAPKCWNRVFLASAQVQRLCCCGPCSSLPHATFQPSLPLSHIHILLKNTPIARLLTLTIKGNFANTNGKAKALTWRRTKQREVWLNNEHYGSRS